MRKKRRPVPARDQILNPLKPKLMRKRISRSETLFGAGFLVFLLLAGAWVLAQKDDFDPGDRDISVETLKKSIDDRVLYVPPLKRWVEPGLRTAGLPAVDLGIFPGEILGGGWDLDGRVETYDASTLYEKINGAAEQYIRFGFRRLHYATLAGDPGFVNVEVYDQAEFRNVMGLFAEQRDPERTVQTRGDIFYYETPVGAVGGFRNFYFKIAGSNETAPVVEKARSLVGALESMPASAGDSPLPFLVLTRDLGIGFDEIEYARSDVFQYDFLSDFWFGAVSGSTGARYFLHQAPGEDRARELFSRLLEEQKYEYSPVEEGPDEAVLRHEYLKTFFTVRRRGTWILGVEGAESRARALQALGRAEEAVAVEQGKADPEA